MVEEISLLSEFALPIVVGIILLTGGSVFAYFINLKRCVRKHKEETNKKIDIIDDRSLRFATAFLHFVKRNDELHHNKITSKVSLGDEIEELLKDPKTGKL